MTSHEPLRIAVLADCTHAAPAMTLRCHDPDLSVMSVPIFAMTPRALAQTADRRFEVRQGRDGQWMDIATFARDSYRAFTQAEAPEALRVVTPGCPAAQIGGPSA